LAHDPVVLLLRPQVDVDAVYAVAGTKVSVASRRRCTTRVSRPVGWTSVAGWWFLASQEDGAVALHLTPLEVTAGVGALTSGLAFTGAMLALAQKARTDRRDALVETRAVGDW